MQTLIVATLLVVSAIAANGSSVSPLKGQKLKILTIVSPPYVSQGSDGKLSGVIVDILNKLSAAEGFTFDLALQPDGAYGALQADGTWNGLVRSLIDGKADVAAADLTITQARDKVIDFTTPLSQFNLKILVNVASGLTNVKYTAIKDSSTVQFLQQSTNPLDQDIWKNIQANPGGLVATSQAGIAAVLQGGSAHIDDQSVLLAAVAANPGKVRIDDRILITQFNALGTPQDSPLRDAFNLAISDLNEKGEIRKTLNQYNVIA
jgi:ABC-type amino acid transport substrate-binding protein